MMSEKRRLELRQAKNELHNMAFKFREENKNITQEHADKLNNSLEKIIDELVCDYKYDMCSDYYVDFNSFVIGSSYYNKFAW